MTGLLVLMGAVILLGGMAIANQQDFLRQGKTIQKDKGTTRDTTLA